MTIDPLTLDEDSARVARAAVTASMNETTVHTGHPNYLALELQGILDDLHDAEHGVVPKRLVRERLERLTEHVERLGDELTELLEAVTSGLEPDQQIRAEALDAALRIALFGDRSAMVDDVLDLADGLADWIRTGERGIGPTPGPLPPTPACWVPGDTGPICTKTLEQRRCDTCPEVPDA